MCLGDRGGAESDRQSPPTCPLTRPPEYKDGRLVKT